MSKKHYVVYFENEKAITKTSKEWAEDNQECFPKFTFIGENKPNSDVIDKFLVSENGFTLISDDEKFVCFNFDENKKNNRYITDAYYGNASDYYIYFTVEKDKYKLIMDESVTLSKNNNNILTVKPGLRDIVTRLELNNNEYLYNNAGNKRTTNELAKIIFDYINNNFILNNN